MIGWSISRFADEACHVGHACIAGTRALCRKVRARLTCFDTCRDGIAAVDSVFIIDYPAFGCTCTKEHAGVYKRARFMQKPGNLRSLNAKRRGHTSSHAGCLKNQDFHRHFENVLHPSWLFETTASCFESNAHTPH